MLFKMYLYPFKNNYIYLKRWKVILRRIIRFSIQFFFQTKSISFQELIEHFDNKNKSFFVLAPGISLDKFEKKQNKKNQFIGISRVISHSINCDFYIYEPRLFNLIKYIQETSKKLKHHKPKGFILKGHSTPIAILPTLIFLFFIKLKGCTAYLLLEIYQADLYKYKNSNIKNNILNCKVTQTKLKEVILQGRTIFDFKYIENYIMNKFTYIGFDNSYNDAIQCEWINIPKSNIIENL